MALIVESLVLGGHICPCPILTPTSLLRDHSWWVRGPYGMPEIKSDQLHAA